MTASRRPAHRLSPVLFPIFLVGLALPLLAPSCGDFQPGVKTFSKGSIIIPMDVCYQCTRQAADGLDAATANCTRTGYQTPVSGEQCPQALSQGDVIKAYGLVYQLIRNDVAVYWVIDPAKATVDGRDLTVQFNNGFPVQRYDWNAGGPGLPPTSAATISYRGGPFVIDGSDYAKAKAVLDAFRGTFAPVNLHVSNVAFQGYVAKTMAGGWGAGGAVAPKLALLDIGSGNLSTRTTAPSSTCDTSTRASCVKSGTSEWTCMSSAKNAEPVIQEYLAKAGIGTGAAGGTATGAHGEIYDKLGIADFQPAPGSTDWRTSNFGRAFDRATASGYQILWVPHWVGPGSCSDFSSSCNCLSSRYPDAQIEQVLKTIAAFSAAGGDVFAECAGLGTFEGAFTGNSGSNRTRDYQDGWPGDASWPATSRFQTTTGVYYNQIPDQNGAVNGTQLTTARITGSFASPQLQLADFPFVPYSGAIEDYRPAGAYYTDVTRLITASTGTPNSTDYTAWDYYTYRPPSTTPGGAHGTSVYLAGHSYTDVQGTFQVAGVRLVLNTLFNLGAACTTSGVACDTGLLGACGRGVLTCGPGGVPVCTPTTTGSTEVCNGIDDDCDGLVDEDLEVGCYGGPIGPDTFQADAACQGAGVPADLRNSPRNPACRPKGLCAKGVSTCQQNPDGSYGFSACTGEVLPAAEVCNGLDDDCNGQVDENLVQACYTGPDSTRSPPGTGTPVGACKAGTQSCQAGSWGACEGQVLPVADPCQSPESGTGIVDLNCDGQVDQCGCTPGETRPCYGGPASTRGAGLCHDGTQACGPNREWGTCQGEVLPAPEICNDDTDQNCNGNFDDTAAGGCLSCTPGATQGCWPGPAGVVFKAPGNRSVCVQGTAVCSAATGEFGACGVGGGTLPVLPGPEVCNGVDDDCDGAVDDGAACGGGFACENGVCVPSTCGPELGCLEGYDCSPQHQCKVTTCGTLGRACDPGTLCVNGTCHDPNEGLTCGAGSAPAGGYCTGGACYEVGCPVDGELCQAGTCVANPCDGVLCPGGTFCRQGDCVQSCAFAGCAANQRCDLDGFCVADACAGRSCAPGQVCQDGACVTDACLGVACGRNQVCRGGDCLDDPCLGVSCPAGLCRDGQCWPATLAVAGAGGGEGGGGGCGCGTGDGSPLALLGLLLAVPLARRRRAAPAPVRRGGPGGPLLLLALLALLGGAAGCTRPAPAFDPASCVAPLTYCEPDPRCVDRNFDPSHCGGCGQGCGAGNQCVDGTCGPGSTVAPRITAVDPATAPRGGLAPQPVVLTGERFKAGATLRVTNAAGTTTVPATLRGDGKLEAALDLQVVPTGTWSLRVVNPDLVISNARAFGVTFPTPVIAKVWPIPDAGGAAPSVAVGAVRRLRLEGTGLMVDSACKVGGGALPEQEVAAELKAAGDGLPAGLECEVDLSRVPPGTYEVWAVNDATHASAHKPFQAISGAPVLTSLAPALASTGTTPAVDLFGSGFDATSAVIFRVLDGTTVVGDRTTPVAFIDATRLVLGALDLLTCPGSPGGCATTGTASAAGLRSYQLLVKNGGLVSAPQDFTVLPNGAAAPAVTSLSKGSGYVGELLTLTVFGANLPGGSVVEARPPGGAFSALPVAPSPAASPTQVSGTLDLAGAAVGSWDVRLRYPAGLGTSSTFPFRVLSNVATITSTPAPAGGAQGLLVPVVLTVSNVNPPSGTLAGVTVVFSGKPTPALVPTAPQAGQLAVAVPLDGLATGVYTLAVVNPGAAPSNAVNFTVSPGVPRLDPGVTCVTPGASCVAGTPPSAPQQSAKVPIRLRGANFARPDAAGNNGTSVHVFAGCTPVVNAQNQVTCTCPGGTALCVPDHVIPSADVAVDTASQLTVQLDTTAAVPGTYSVWVWNPGGSPSPQRSNTLPGAFRITP